ncbi:MAG: OmpA family protein [Hyphomicrobiaceae bacterium]|nr:OmpA family protein [Hyphomicrobiaceae bacterium]
MRFRVIWLAFSLSLAAGTPPLHAETAEDIVRALLPKPKPPLTRSLAPGEQPAQAPGGLSRSFRPAEPAAKEVTRGIAVEGGESEPESPPKIDLYVNFEFNQSALTMSDARVALDVLGKALQDTRLDGMRFAIIGHTDAVGTDAYNMELSQRRAAAVRAYLIQFHRISEQRLKAEGRGFRELKDPADPRNAVNRRVEVRNLVDSASAGPVSR